MLQDNITGLKIVIHAGLKVNFNAYVFNAKIVITALLCTLSKLPANVMECFTYTLTTYYGYHKVSCCLNVQTLYICGVK